MKNINVTSAIIILGSPIMLGIRINRPLLRLLCLECMFIDPTVPEYVALSQ